MTPPAAVRVEGVVKRFGSTIALAGVVALASACTRAVTSACTPTKFVRVPAPSNTGDMDTSFQNAVPCLR